MDGIGYVANGSGATNSFNETFSVENDDQALYLRPMGPMGMRPRTVARKRR